MILSSSELKLRFGLVRPIDTPLLPWFPLPSFELYASSCCDSISAVATFEYWPKLRTGLHWPPYFERRHYPNLLKRGVVLMFRDTAVLRRQAAAEL